jgi:stage II sporulation protein D
MKAKLTAILLTAALVLAGCRQPIQTPTPGPSESPAGSPSLGGVSAKIPKLPDRFTGKTSADITLKVYDIKAKEIKEMGLNDYLSGVLAGEVQADWPIEALKAQAIIARTFLFQFLTENNASSVNPQADISTDPKESQAFDEAGVNDNIRSAVLGTDGMVIAYDGQFIRAWFHSCSGGVTADAVEGLNFKDGNPPYIQSVPSDESLAPKDEQAWQGTFTSDDISAALSKVGTGGEKEISDFKIGKKGPTGRAETFVINGQDVPAPDFRVAMDPMKFRSTLITELNWDGSKLTVKGKGYGHGVGMSQWGALAMAKAGKKAEEIVQYYFKDISIVNLWNK